MLAPPMLELAIGGAPPLAFAYMFPAPGAMAGLAPASRLACRSHPAAADAGGWPVGGGLRLTLCFASLRNR